MRKQNESKSKAEKSNAPPYKPHLISAKEEENGNNEEIKDDITGVKNLSGDEFDKKFEMMLVCLLYINFGINSWQPST